MNIVNLLKNNLTTIYQKYFKDTQEDFDEPIF